MKAFAVEEVKSQSDLAIVALQADDWFHRRAAVLRLEDQSTLETIAQGDDYWIVRLVATMRLTNLSVLVDIMVGDGDRTVRRAALDRLMALGALSLVPPARAKHVLGPETLVASSDSTVASAHEGEAS